MLSQYDDEGILYSVTFYNKNIILKKCNYEIYDKKLLIIIKYLKHWRLKLKTTNISIKIFIDYKLLKHFIIIKELFRRQTYWAFFYSNLTLRSCIKSGHEMLKLIYWFVCQNSRLRTRRTYKINISIKLF